MSGPTAAGTFATGSTAIGVGSQTSDSCVINTGRTSMRLTITGADASNTVRTQKRTTPGGAWADQTTYNSNQSATSIPVVAGEEWRLITVAMQPVREIRYMLDAQ